VHGSDLSPDEADAYRMADNRLTELGGWHEEERAQILAELAAKDQLLGTGWTGDDVDQLLRDLGLLQTKEETFDVGGALEAEVQPRIKRGEVWQLGRHRLMCGDSSSPQDIGSLMDAHLADLILTDPPYGMGKEFASDALKPPQLREWNESWIEALPAAEDCIFVCFHSPRLFWTALDAAREKGWRFLRYLAFYKPNDMAFPWHGWLGVSESILLFARGDPRFNEKLPSDTSLWHDTYYWTHKNLLLGETSADRQQMHPTIKPIPIIEDLLWKCSHDGDLVADVFLGSGTTLVSAERLGRVCYGMEIEPRYCEVAIQRWEDYTGQKAVRVDAVS